MDVIEIARRVKGIGDNKQTVHREAYQYWRLTLKNKTDKEKLRKNVFNGGSFTAPQVNFEKDAKGVWQIDLTALACRCRPGSPLTAKSTAASPRKTYCAETIEFGYIMTGLEKQLFAELARALKFGNRFVQVIGPSGRRQDGSRQDVFTV